MDVGLPLALGFGMENVSEDQLVGVLRDEDGRGLDVAEDELLALQVLQALEEVRDDLRAEAVHLSPIADDLSQHDRWEDLVEVYLSAAPGELDESGEEF